MESSILKRARGPNFTPSEIISLLDLIEKYQNVLENKKTDGATIMAKNKTWQRIAEEFNASNSEYHRTEESIRACYRTQKKKMKKGFSVSKMEIPSPAPSVDFESVITAAVEDDDKVSDSFVSISNQKMELVQLEKEIFLKDLEEKRKQMEHNEIIRGIELKIKKAEYELVLQKLENEKNKIQSN